MLKSAWWNLIHALKLHFSRTTGQSHSGLLMNHNRKCCHDWTVDWWTVSNIRAFEVKEPATPHRSFKVPHVTSTANIFHTVHHFISWFQLYRIFYYILKWHLTTIAGVKAFETSIETRKFRNFINIVCVKSVTWIAQNIIVSPFSRLKKQKEIVCFDELSFVASCHALIRL